MDETIIFSLAGAGKRYGTKTVFSDITLSFFLGAKIGIIGANGSGKTTLMKIMAGLDTNFDGHRMISPDVTVGYLPQEPHWNLDFHLDLASEALRCPPDNQLTDNLSGGERRRTALCRLLLSRPDVLLLDEPTNHLDAETVAWLEHYLHNYHGTVILITHDRYFLDNVTGWILELEKGRGIPWKGNYASWLEQKEERLRLEGKTASKRRKNLQKELEWMQKAAPQRRLRSKARLKSLDALRESGTQSQAREEAELWIPPGPRLGDQVITTHALTKSYDGKILFEDLNIDVPPGAIVGVVGANGAGKTTLFRLISGTEAPDSGEVKLGGTVKAAWADQLRERLDPSVSVWQQISGGKEMISLGGRDVNSRAWLGRFGFSGTDQNKLVGQLSGGERNRLNLALVLQEEGNLLLLDEPTNDLDVATIRSLEDALDTFPGCAVVVSHDRWFLDRVATHILAFEGDGQLIWYPGSWSEYDEDRRRRLGSEADTPKRIKYRRLTHDS